MATPPPPLRPVPSYPQELPEELWEHIAGFLLVPKMRAFMALCTMKVTCQELRRAAVAASKNRVVKVRCNQGNRGVELEFDASGERHEAMVIWRHFVREGNVVIHGRNHKPISPQHWYVSSITKLDPRLMRHALPRIKDALSNTRVMMRETRARRFDHKEIQMRVTPEHVLSLKMMRSGHAHHWQTLALALSKSTDVRCPVFGFATLEELEYDSKALLHTLRLMDPGDPSVHFSLLKSSRKLEMIEQDIRDYQNIVGALVT